VRERLARRPLLTRRGETRRGHYIADPGGKHALRHPLMTVSRRFCDPYWLLRLAAMRPGY
jgi:hypothetical protein